MNSDTDKKMYIDVVFCIDVSMKNRHVLSEIRMAIAKFPSKVRQELDCAGKEVGAIRGRIVIFGSEKGIRNIPADGSFVTDNGDGAGFFQMLKQQTDVEGKECATDTLQAVLQAAESDWTKDKAYVRQTVAVFTSSDLSADDAGKEKAEKFAGAWEYVFKEKASAVDRAMLYVWTTDENKWKDIAYSVGSVALKKQGVRMYNDSFYDLPYWAACPQNDIERLKFIVRRSRQ